MFRKSYCYFPTSSPFCGGKSAHYEVNLFLHCWGRIEGSPILYLKNYCPYHPFTAVSVAAMVTVYDKLQSMLKKLNQLLKQHEKGRATQETRCSNRQQGLWLQQKQQLVICDKHGTFPPHVSPPASPLLSSLWTLTNTHVRTIRGIWWVLCCNFLAYQGIN